MKKRRLISLLCVLCLLTACAGKSGTPKLFFLWTQGYLATPCGEEGMVALTLYAKKLSSPFDLSAPGVIRLDGISPEDIRITCDLSAADVDSGQGYQAYSLILTYTPLRAGVYVCPNRSHLRWTIRHSLPIRSADLCLRSERRILRLRTRGVLLPPPATPPSLPISIC